MKLLCPICRGLAHRMYIQENHEQGRTWKGVPGALWCPTDGIVLEAGASALIVDPRLVALPST